MRVAQPNAPMKYWKSSLTSSVLLAGRGAIAAPLPEMVGVGSLMPIVHSDELVSAFLELEATLL
jgi:hypothetical protein